MNDKSFTQQSELLISLENWKMFTCNEILKWTEKINENNPAKKKKREYKTKILLLLSNFCLVNRKILS